MRLVHDNQVPRCGEHLIVLVEVAADKFRAAQVLHGGEIDIMQSLNLCPALKICMAFTVVLGAVGKVVAVIEYLAEVLEPSAVHHGAVGQDERPPEIHVLDHLQGREGLAETHLGVPEHLVAFPELPFRLLNGFPLFGAEHNGAASVCYLSR